MSRIDERIEDEELRALLPRLRRFALSLVHEPVSADELVRTCLEHAQSKRRVRETSTSLRSWLFAILYHQFLDLRRRVTLWQRLLATVYPEADSESVVERWITGSSPAFARLSVENRALLLMVTVEGFTYQETALVLAIPATSVLPRLVHARQLYQHLSERMRVVAPLRRVK